MRFVKYHALGNDYLIIPTTELAIELNREQIQRICHRNYGIGSDGILLGPLPSESCDYRLRIFNPDGSEAEKSGNGLRIFSRFLWDEGLVKGEPFTVETPGGAVICPRATPNPTAPKWVAGGQAAAVVSGAFCLSSNLAGATPHGGDYAGVGWIIEPGEGKVLGLTSPAEPYLTLDIDLEEADRAKETYPRYVLD